MRDYKKLKLKVGLEIHAQVDSFKLFCNCFSTMDESPRKKIMRKLHPVAGELGEIDIAAKHEHLKNKNFYYQVFNDTTCLIDSDDEPPKDVNTQSLDVAITLANMFNCYIPDELHFMRKTVIDGSNTSGFQRTGLIGVNGFIPTSFGRVGVTNLQLEEDSCGIVNKERDSITYRLDRLGIPLLEIGTTPDAKTPLQAKELAETIGMYLKSTGKIKKGLNAIRQDINISIKNGNRVELKGVQSLSSIPKAVEMEVERQEGLLNLKSRISKLRFSKVENVSDIFKNSDCKILGNKRVYCLKIPHAKNLFSEVIQANKTLGNEISDYVKARTTSKGYIHSDENLEKYNIPKAESEQVKTKMKCQPNDLFVLVSEVPNALSAIVERLTSLVDGIPEETRRFKEEDGTTVYMRPMPGKARMYPETDVKPIVLKSKKIKTPTLISKRIEDMGKKYKFSSNMSKSLINSNYFEIFEKYASLDPKFIFSVVTSYLKEAEKRKPLELYDVENIILLWKNKKISKDGVQDLIKDVSEGKDFGLIYEKKYKTKKNLDDVIDKIIKDKKSYIKDNKERAIKPLMGLVMKEVRGTVSGDLIYKKLEKKIREV